MPTIEVQVHRFSVVSSKPFEEIVRTLTATIGHPDMKAFHDAVAAATTVLRKERGGQGPRLLRLLVGNPLIMKEMARTVPDAASYAPVTILVDERPDGVHLSYWSITRQSMGVH